MQIFKVDLFNWLLTIAAICGPITIICMAWAFWIANHGG